MRCRSINAIIGTASRRRRRRRRRPTPAACHLPTSRLPSRFPPVLDPFRIFSFFLCSRSDGASHANAEDACRHLSLRAIAWRGACARRTASLRDDPFPAFFYFSEATKTASNLLPTLFVLLSSSALLHLSFLLSYGQARLVFGSFFSFGF